MDQVAEIRDKVDIVSLLSEYLTLKKAGRNFKALCPFHNEKTPSFVISPERQIWHCFGGCNKGGDAYQFIMDYEKVDFPEALRVLAKRTGVTLKNRDLTSGESSKKERLYKINSVAKEFYHYVLTKHPAGKKALLYLKKRGVDVKVINTFALGFSPSTGNSLSKYLIGKKKFSMEDVVDAGLGFQRGSFGRLRTGGEAVDFFRGRLIFPLIDHRDNVVGFAGRILHESSDTAKYVNTRDTLVYHKGEHIFGLSVTKDAIRRENQAVIVEGEFDVISCFQNGVGNVVAVKGTALTDAQVNLLSRFTPKITFCFDADRAGQEAIRRSLTVVEKRGLSPTVVEIPGGKDPDEALSENPARFKKAVKEDASVYDYLLKHALEEYDRETAEGKKKIADGILPFVAQITNEIVKEHYLRKIADSLETTYESIVREAERLVKKEARVVVQPEKSVKRSKDEVLEEYLLALIVQAQTPKNAVKAAVEILSDSMSRDRAYHKIMDHLLTHFEKNDQLDGEKFAGRLPKELISAFDTSVLFPLPVFESSEKIITEVEKTAQKLKTIYIQEKLKKLAVEIGRLEREGGDVGKYKKQYSHLASQLGK
jgi:DNA primase